MCGCFGISGATRGGYVVPIKDIDVYPYSLPFVVWYITQSTALTLNPGATIIMTSDFPILSSIGSIIRR